MLNVNFCVEEKKNNLAQGKQRMEDWSEKIKQFVLAFGVVDLSYTNYFQVLLHNN